MDTKLSEDTAVESSESQSLDKRSMNWNMNTQGELL